MTEEGIYLKDLSRLGRDLRRVIIVDNIKENFERQDANGIEIKTWIGDAMDRELDTFSVFLRGLAETQVRDVRPLIKLFKADLEALKKAEEAHLLQNVSPTKQFPTNHSFGQHKRMIPIYKKE